MDLATMHLWSAGYDLPAAKRVEAKPQPKRREKKAPKGKRARKK